MLTNDFNLNRVAELQGVRVMNINSLANAVKPAVLPGEELRVKVIQEGKEAGQGVGFLDDGTMIVVEGGARLHRPRRGRRRHPRPPDRRRADDLRPAASRLSSARARDRRPARRSSRRRDRRRGRLVAAHGRHRQARPRSLGGRPLLAWSLAAIAAASRVERMVVVVAPIASRRSPRPAGCRRGREVVAGGPRRQDSVAAGRPAPRPAIRPARIERVVLVHDGARPLVSPALVEAVVDARRRGHGAAIPVLPVAETLKRVDGDRVVGTVERAGLAAAQTPQGVRRRLLRDA